MTAQHQPIIAADDDDRSQDEIFGDHDLFEVWQLFMGLWDNHASKPAWLYDICQGRLTPEQLDAWSAATGHITDALQEAVTGSPE